MRAGIALGANLGDRLHNLTTARDAIFALPNVDPPRLASSLYETDPVGCEADAARFLNAVIEIGYEGEPVELLRALQRIETSLGRPAQHERNRSRTIDLDLLYHGACVLHATELQLPHPRLRLRGFVLHPLAEIRPDLVLPEQTKTVWELSGESPPNPSVVRSALQW